MAACPELLPLHTPWTTARELQMVPELQQQNTGTKLVELHIATSNFLFYTFWCVQINKLLLIQVKTKLMEEEMGGNFRCH